MVGRWPGSRGASTPEATSTPTAAIDRSASATFVGASPPARVTGSSRATAAARAATARWPVPPGCGPPAVSSSRRADALRRDGRGRASTMTRAAAVGSDGVSTGRWSTFHTGRPTGGCGADGFVAVELDGVRVDVARRCPPRTPAGVGGDRDEPGRDPAGTRRARPRPASAASSTVRPRGVPGTRLRPIASAPRVAAAMALPASPTPQILTKGRRATFAGSSGGAPAATNARTVALGSVERTSASPTRAPSKPCGSPPGDRDGVANTRLGDDQPVVGDGRAQTTGPLRIDRRGSGGRGC